LAWHSAFPSRAAPGFRGAHLAAIAFVVAETLLGFMCPLTIWEDALRGDVSEAGFIQRWIHAWLFFNWPAWGVQRDLRRVRRSGRVDLGAISAAAGEPLEAEARPVSIADGGDKLVLDLA